MHSALSSSPSASDPALRQNRHTVAQLEKSEIYRDYRQAFETTTGLPLGLRASGSFQSGLQASRQVNPFCALMAGTNKTCAACLQLQQRVEQEAVREPRTLECFAGLSESAVPVRVGENVVGYLQTGQVLLSAPTQGRFKKILGLLAEWKVAVDRSALQKAYFGTRVLARQHYESVLRLLGIFGQHLSALSNQLVVRETQAEAPAITKARAFISAHQTEEIALADVARAVGLSEFYFCKMFKKETGVTFVDYLARTRVETLKQLLLNPHKRVSEAAYEVGFQSLSQFNRVFRRIAGEAPSSYRDKLHHRHRAPVAVGHAAWMRAA
ncbi:MAG TPA: helix-turn-helix domain-containing protein [Opitutaceae bacterium]|nr:helix-turn-helix domain-containing protein [Opitutaceae bacterium]